MANAPYNMNEDEARALSSSSSSSLSSSSAFKTNLSPGHQREEVDNFTCGDLGFGFCLKPGGIPVRKFNPDTLEYEDDLPDNSLVSKLLSFSDDDDGEFKKLRSSSTPCLRSRDRMYSETCTDSDLRWERFPVFDGVPLGTSLRQQRALYAEKMKEYRDKKKLYKKESAIREYSDSGSSLDLLGDMPDADNIQRKLMVATEEVEVLQCELDACKRQLDSKYRAIQILKSQSMLVNATQKKFVESSTIIKKSLEKEVNSLQFELDVKMSSLMLSEQTWAERFDRLCLENAALMATLQARSDELRKMHTEKMALIREKDELIARMDAKERLEYDKESSLSSNNSGNNDDCRLAELSVLGACACRGSRPEPCRCAKAAAKLKKENHQLMAEVTRLSHELAAAHLSADSFRLAFEDQLDHNSTLGWHVVQDMNKKKKTIRLPWKRKANHPDKETTLNGDGNTMYDDTGGSIHEGSAEKDDAHDMRSIGVQASQPEPALIGTLIELLNDRSQALAHQRLVAKMLARRAQDLEQTMSRLTKLSGSHEI
ncbi:coiled-coil domain-containing protein 125-like isoform X2 [Amphiura filiformis]|uniref:coiled-coil domain-containing protein 125-like isoform X2 n=1 Tax=Amphiura filiformis TaxID=82378 RepID=UPI003B20D460